MQPSTRTRAFRNPRTGRTYDCLAEIGNGAFGVAYSVKDRHDRTFCIKRIDINASDLHDAVREVSIMKTMCVHPNVVRYYDSWQLGKHLCILMEYVEGGALSGLMEACRKQNRFFPEKRIVHYAEELAGALDYFHNSLGMLHRDIKPDNILVDQFGSLKLVDFGVSKFLGHAALAHTAMVGTPLYMAPELLDTEATYSFPADMWSLGCVLYELMALHRPFDARKLTRLDIFRLAALIRNTKIDFDCLAARYSARLVKMVRWMLQHKTHKRATARDLVDLLELREPPSLLQTMRGMPPPPLSEEHSLASDDSRGVPDDALEATAPVDATQPYVPTVPPSLEARACLEVSVDALPERGRYEPSAPPASPLQRRGDIVRDALRLLDDDDAARRLQRSFRLSMERRRAMRAFEEQEEEAAEAAARPGADAAAPFFERRRAVPKRAPAPPVPPVRSPPALAPLSAAPRRREFRRRERSRRKPRDFRRAAGAGAGQGAETGATPAPGAARAPGAADAGTAQPSRARAGRTGRARRVRREHRDAPQQERHAPPERRAQATDAQPTRAATERGRARVPGAHRAARAAACARRARRSGAGARARAGRAQGRALGQDRAPALRPHELPAAGAREARAAAGGVEAAAGAAPCVDVTGAGEGTRREDSVQGGSEKMG